MGWEGFSQRKGVVEWAAGRLMMKGTRWHGLGGSIWQGKGTAAADEGVELGKQRRDDVWVTVGGMGQAGGSEHWGLHGSASHKRLKMSHTKRSR